MDELKYLILDLRKGGQDITKEVVSFSFRGNCTDIIFKTNAKLFSYKKENVFISSSPVFVESDIAVNGNIVFAAEKKLLFGNFLKLFFNNGKTTEIHYGDYEVLKTKIPVFLSYYKNVAEQVKSLPSKEGETVNLVIADFIAKIKHLSVDNPLYSYLSGRLPRTSKRISHFIFPFPCNESQLNAIEKAFSSPLSIIQGPPGTGKTQTILNILMNALMNDQKIAVVSSNNSAIQNVLDKLSISDGFGFLAALLGNKDNQCLFLQNQPEYPPWLNEKTELSSEDEQKVYNLYLDLKQLFALQNEQKTKQTELNQWKIESEKFTQSYPDITPLKTIMTSDQLMGLFYKCNTRNLKYGKLSLWFIVWQVIFCCRWNFDFWRKPLEILLPILKKTYYQSKISELQEIVFLLEKQLENSNFEKKHKLLNELSLKIIKNKLQKKYRHSGQDRKKFCKIDLRKPCFLAEYPVLLSTTFLIKLFAPEGGFDLLVMDEASQVDLCSGIVALSCAKKVVIVGDNKQLPCVITTQDENKIKDLNASTNIPDVYKYRPNQSILSSIQQAIPEIPTTTLCEHYRCDPLIIGFCNQKFYNGKLVIHSKSSEEFPLRVLFTAPGNHARGHFNLRQNQEINQLVNNLLQRHHYSENSIGICTPYREQAERLGAYTVHKFQGREKDVIIMSTVDNQISSFTADEQLVNVAVSRAKKEFYLVISSSNRKWENCIGDLVNYIQYYDQSGDSFINGNITSVFDLLYTEYQQYGLSLKKSLFDSPAEEIIYTVLTDVIKTNDQAGRYAFQLHIPLREIFHSTQNLSNDETHYLKQANTHVDFLVYEKFGKKPCFGIEVDGYTFHKAGSRQAERDQMKNCIFSKNNIPLLRLSTNDSNEYVKIKQFFMDHKNCFM